VITITRKMPPVDSVPPENSSVRTVIVPTPANGPAKSISSLFTQSHFEQIFPYAKASAVFTHDNQAFWTYSDFLTAVAWMNNHQNPIYHNFGTESADSNINLLELASFLGNFHQETGDPSLLAPYPWSWPKVLPQGKIYEGPAGGALAVMEGCISQPFIGTVPAISNQRQSAAISLTDNEKMVIGTTENTITGLVTSFVTLNQPSFGLGRGTGNGAVFQPGLVAVSEDGTLWGDDPVNQKVGPVNPSSGLVKDNANPRYASLTPCSQYGGRGAIQLSYNFNYSDCSIALFDDYRLAKYPNLIVTTDRVKFLDQPSYFGFPGPNPGGNNQLPSDISKDTPPARVLAWLVCFWFWMDRNRSGRKISCHQCMLEPTKYGITGCNMIVNNQSGCSTGWAYNKVVYYRRICKIFGIADSLVDTTIVCPPNPATNA
jgi:hypothetical protein